MPLQKTYYWMNTYPNEADLLKETWPFPQENTVKEFEEFLMDIGLRF